MQPSEFDASYMARALELGARGQGSVEPNPLVGCTIVANDQVVGEGWHRRYGGPHAETDALSVAGRRAAGATLYVTLEPCCHQGQTPPCTDAIIAAGIRRVVAAMSDPFAQVSGRGFAALEQAGIAVEVGLLAHEARHMNAPYLKLLERHRPWIIAKWAMSLDGKIATRSGDSRWISSPESRAIVHRLRGRVDAILVGRGTAVMDDPLLSARPPGPRRALRVVADTRATLASSSQLVRTAGELALLVAVGSEAPAADRARLERAGAEVLICDGAIHAERLDQLLVELGRRRLTNVLVEGGGQLLGSLLDGDHIDEVHVFIGPRLIGGTAAPTPFGGNGRGSLSDAAQIVDPRVEPLGSDVYLSGRVRRAT